MSFFSPLAAFDAISLDEINECLVAWQHRMGPLERPNFGFGRYYGLRHDGALVGVAAVDQMISAATCDLGREEAIELTRVCAIRPDLCRVVLRLWREFVFPALSDAWGMPWAISYQDNKVHDGGLYRFDGWVRIGRTRSGTDTRAAGGTKRGRDKTVWAWCRDDFTRAIVRGAGL